LVAEVETSLVLTGESVFCSRKNGRWEEWSALHQRRQERVKPSGLFSALSPASSLQSPGGTSAPSPQPSKSSFPWFSKAILHFCHEGGAEEWLALHRCAQDWAKAIGPTSALAQVGLPRTCRRSGVVSLVVKVETSLVLKESFVFCCQEGSALIRCRPDWAKPVGPISALAQQASLPH